MELSPAEKALLARRESCIPAVVQKLKLQDGKRPTASLRAYVSEEDGDQNSEI